MRIQWHGHSCFQVTCEGYSVVFDPYGNRTVPGYKPLHLQADAVFCSHEHSDHNARHVVKLSGRQCPLKVEELASFHDDQNGSLRGPNRIHILHGEGMRLVHLGDLGHPLSGSALESVRGADALLIPVGGYFTIDAPTAKAVVDAAGARVVFPMHYRLGNTGFDVLGSLDAFTSLCNHVNFCESDSFDLQPDTPSQTVVLTYGK